MNIIDLDKNIYEITQEHPELIDLLSSLGFIPLKNQMLRKTLGRTTTLRQGARLIQLPLKEIKRHLKLNGYIIKEEKND